MEALKLKDFLNYRFLSGVQYAPDGSKAAFVAASANEEENSYERRLWLWDGRLRQLTDLGKEGSFCWEDADTLLFPADRSAKERKRRESGEEFTAYYRLSLSGGEALPAFTLPFTALGVKPLGEGKYLALGDIDARRPDYFEMTEKARAEVAKEYAEEKDYEVFDEIPFWGNGMGVINKRRRALFLITAEPWEIRRVTEDPFLSVDSLEILGDYAFFSGRSYESRMPLAADSLFRLNWRSGELRHFPLPEKCELSLQAVGQELWAFATIDPAHGGNQNSDVYRVDRETGELTLLRREEYSMYSSVGSDCRLGGGRQGEVKGGSYYHLTTREGSSHLYRVDGDGQSHPVVTKEGSIDCVTVSPAEEKALMVAMYDGRLQELYQADLKTGKVKRLSHFNDAALKGKYIAPFRALSVESEGLTIGGWVLEPKDYDPSKTYPAVFDVHGGPKTVYGPVFYHEMQLWANMGYFVFFCNPKGSDGRDNDFMDIFGHYGETDYRNLMDFADAVLTAYPQIDPKRVCLTGGSYGGFMTNWIIGHTDRFCCAASQRSISNWLSFYGVSDIGYFFAPDQCRGDVFTPEGREALLRQSPLCYAGNVTTPTLFIHSDEDYRCPMAEGLQMYTALADRGVPARLCLFHGENHELSRSGKPRHRVRRLREITDWFEKYSRPRD